MKKVVFTLSAITGIAGVCACGLVIDADKLVEGNATPADDASPGDATTGDGAIPPDLPDAVADAGPDGPTLIEIPECVPVAPAGTQGPYAVTYVNAPTAATCPTGYLATPIQTAKGNMAVEDFVCGSTTGCTCAAPSGTPTCSVRLNYYVNSQCTVGAGSDTLGAACLDINSDDYLKVVVTSGGVTCNSNGPTSIAPTVKPTPTFGENWVVCAPDPNVKLAQCKSDQVAVPPAKDAGACVITTAVACPAPYTQDIGLSKAGTFDDTRRCACACGVGASTCTGASAMIYSKDSCADTGKAFAIDTCLPRNGDDGMTAVVPTPTPSCAAQVAKDGTVSASNDLHLCCLP